MKSPLHKYLLSLPIFGLNGIVASHISLPSYEIVFLRTLLGSAALLLIYLLRGGHLSLRANKKDTLFVTLSGIMLGISWLFLFEAYGRIGVGTATLLYYFGPVIVVLMSPLVFHERLTLPRILGLILAVPGMLLIHRGAPMEGGTFLGILCGIAAAVFYSLMLLFSKFSRQVTGLESSILQLFGSFLAVSLYVGGKNHFLFSVPAGAWPWLLILGLFNTALGCFLYFAPLSELPAQTIAICGYLEPLSALVFSVILLREALSPLQMLGAFCILAGSCLGELRFSLQKGALV